MFITPLYATLLQIFCEFMLNLRIISISITGPDDTCKWDLPAWMVEVITLISPTCSLWYRLDQWILHRKLLIQEQNQLASTESQAPISRNTLTSNDGDFISIFHSSAFISLLSLSYSVKHKVPWSEFCSAWTWKSKVLHLGSKKGTKFHAGRAGLFWGWGRGLFFCSKLHVSYVFFVDWKFIGWTNFLSQNLLG